MIHRLEDHCNSGPPQEESSRFSERAPRVVLMAGLPGAGKTTLARELEQAGLVRLCPDEEMYRRHGVRGRDYPRSEYLALELDVLTDIAAELQDHVRTGHDVVLDHGLWTRQQRDDWRRVVAQGGGQWLLMYLPASHTIRWARIQLRHQQRVPLPAEFSESDLRRYEQRFEPLDDDEPHLVYDGHPDRVLATLCRMNLNTGRQK